jgi:ribonuclease-3 family protein
MKNYLPVSPLKIEKRNLFDYNPLTLSLIGDGVHTLYIRTMLLGDNPYNINELHTKVCDKVCAQAQATDLKVIVELLNEDELFIYKKCKNAKNNHVPKHASLMEYKNSTAFEGLIGYLYLNGQQERLIELMDTIYNKKDEEI